MFLARIFSRHHAMSFGESENTKKQVSKSNFLIAFVMYSVVTGAPCVMFFLPSVSWACAMSPLRTWSDTTLEQRAFNFSIDSLADSTMEVSVGCSSWRIKGAMSSKYFGL